MTPTENDQLDNEPDTFEPLGAVVDRVMAKLIAQMAENQIGKKPEDEKALP